MKIIKRTLLLLIALLICFSGSVKAESVVYSSNANAGKRIALTFDDGPHLGITPKILKILEEYNVKATFFVIGVNAKNYPKQLSMIHDAGHEIGNHTYSHSVLKSMSREEIKKEISDTKDIIFKLTGSVPSVMRPPCGLYDKTLLEVAKEENLKVVLWAIDTHDWAHSSSANMVRNITKNSKDGDIILFHDYVSGEYNTPETLKIIIPRLLKMGYEFVTVSELLQNAK